MNLRLCGLVGLRDETENALHTKQKRTAGGAILLFVSYPKNSASGNRDSRMCLRATVYDIYA